MGINDNISSLRKSRGYSQEEVANKLDVSRQTYIRYESGDGDLSASDLQKVADFYGVEIYELFYQPQNFSKFKQMLIYILSKFEGSGVTKTKLAKLLYLSDFTHYYNHLESMSNALYKCKEYGPLAEPFLETIDDMFEKGELHIDILGEGAQILHLSKSINSEKVITLLSKEEKTEIDKICNKWKDVNSQELVNFTHNQKPWMACRRNEIIPYDLILQEDPSNVY